MCSHAAAAMRTGLGALFRRAADGWQVDAAGAGHDEALDEELAITSMV